MVSECLRNDTGFGVCLIKTGREVGQPAVPVSVGTYARIIDWQQNPDGLLGITITGQQRFHLRAAKVRADNLIQGEIDWIEQESAITTPGKFQSLQDLLSQHFSDNGHRATAELNDAIALGFRLAELTPCSLEEKQQLLELTDPVTRLEYFLNWYNQADKTKRSL